MLVEINYRKVSLNCTPCNWQLCCCHPKHWAPKGGYTFVTLPRIVTPYRDSVDETRARVKYQKLVMR